MRLLSDYFFHYEKVLTDVDHDRLLYLCDTFQFEEVKKPEGEFYNLDGYRYQVSLEPVHGEIYDLVHKAVMRTMPKVYRDFGDLLPKDYDKYSGYWLCKYPENGFLSSHSDSDGDATSLTLSYHINDNYEGGELCFWKDTYLHNVANSMHVYPSNLLYPHEVKPVTKGIRYSVIAWFGNQKGETWSI